LDKTKATFRARRRACIAVHDVTVACRLWAFQEEFDSLDPTCVLGNFFALKGITLYMS